MKTVINNSAINYTDQGNGDTLILLHGFTESLSIWDSFAKELSKYFRVICIDLPGHGNSKSVSNIHPMELMADIVKSLLDKLSVKKCVIVGHSMGGYVSLAFARKYSNILQGLGLLHSTAHADNEAAKEARMRAIEIIKDDHHKFLSSFIPTLFAPGNENIFNKEMDNLLVEAKKMEKEAIIAAQLGMKSRADSKDILANADHPLMFITGHKDSRIAIDDIQAQAKLCKTAYCLLLKNSGHMGFIEEKQRTLHFLKSFTTACYLEK